MIFFSYFSNPEGGRVPTDFGLLGQRGALVPGLAMEGCLTSLGDVDPIQGAMEKQYDIKFAICRLVFYIKKNLASKTFCKYQTQNYFVKNAAS